MNNQYLSKNNSFNIVRSEFEAFKRWGFAASSNEQQIEKNEFDDLLKKAVKPSPSEQKQPVQGEKKTSD